MRLDDLMTSYAATDGDVSTEAVENAAWAFVAAGGHIGLSEYRALSVESRVALRRAQDKLWATRFASMLAVVRAAMIDVQGDALGEVAQAKAERMADALAGGCA